MTSRCTYVYVTNLPTDSKGNPKQPTSRSRFYIERKNCLSGYPPTMLYGAAVLAPTVYDSPYRTVWVRIRHRIYAIPKPLLIGTKPFNTYNPGTTRPTDRDE